MVAKWLEQRWKVWIPALEPLGKEQEEHIRVLCACEKEWWRQRPGMKERGLAGLFWEGRDWETSASAVQIPLDSHTGAWNVCEPDCKNIRAIQRSFVERLDESQNVCDPHTHLSRC